jgi:hypothetical protein
VKQQRGARIGGEFAALGARDMAVKDKAVGVEALHQHHARVRHSVGIDRCQRHRGGIVRFGFHGLVEPLCEQRKRFLGGGEITSR